MNSYELSRDWWDFCFDNPEKISPNHSAIFFFAIEHCNRLGWRNKFGFGTQMAMDAVGIKKNQTYMRYFNELVEWGFFVLVEKSTNQYSANIISLRSALPKNSKALDKAIINHSAKQTETTGQSNSPIDKPINHITNKPINKETGKLDFSMFDNPEINDHWSRWKEYRVTIKKSFKSELSEQQAIKNLAKLSNGSSHLALLIIDQSIGDQYQGLFKLKYDPSDLPSTTNSSSDPLVNYVNEQIKKFGPL